MKHSLFPFLLLALTTICQAAPEETFTIRGHHWGDTPDQVIKKEGTNPDGRTAEYLAYEGKLAGSEIVRFFYFVEDELYRVDIIFTEKITFPHIAINEYNRIDALFKEKYGMPVSTGPVRLSSMPEEYRSELEVEFAMGRVKFVSTWRARNTEISHFLVSKGDYDPTHVVQYINQTRIPKVRAQEKKDLLDEL